MEQGRNTLLKSNLDRKERERDELQRRVQQLSSQSSGLASVTIAEAQKEVATLTQQLAFKEQDVGAKSCQHMQYYTVLYCTVLHCTVLHFFLLHCIMLLHALQSLPVLGQ